MCAVTVFHCDCSLFISDTSRANVCVLILFRCYRFCCFNGFRVIPVKNRSVVVQMCTSFVSVSVMMSFN